MRAKVYGITHLIELNTMDPVTTTEGTEETTIPTPVEETTGEPATESTEAAA